MRIGLLTGGGDAPGLNGVLESVSRCLLKQGHELVGILDGFEGVFDGKQRPIGLHDVEGMHNFAGTFLGTSNKTGTQGREKEFLEKFRALRLDGLVAAGGDGTFAGLKSFASEVPMIGVPKTIDNDLAGTDVTFGYDTACSVVAESVDALRATADAHRRVIVVETMGRTAGWIALGGGLASYADVILIPERPFDPARLSAHIKSVKASGRRRGLMVVVAEGARQVGGTVHVAFEVAGSPQAERFGGIGHWLARWIEKETAWESRDVVLGHLQRARSPTTTDRFLTLSMGVQVAEMVRDGAWNQAVVMRGGQITRAPIQELMAPPKLVSERHRWVRMAEELGLWL